MPYSQYLVKSPISNGMRPGEFHPITHFEGCDLNWLVSQGVIEPAGSPVDYTPSFTPVDPVQQELANMRAELAALRGTQQAFPAAAPSPQFAPTLPPKTMFPTPETQGQAAAFQQRENQFRAENVVKPLSRQPGQAERLPVPTGVVNAPQTDNRPVLQAIAELREALTDEIRRFASEETGKNVTVTDSEEVNRLRADLESAQSVAADLQQQLAEARQMIANHEQATAAPTSPPKPAPQPAPGVQTTPTNPPAAGPAPAPRVNRPPRPIR